MPGAYGVFHRECVCGKKLATTFLGGRSRYEALCPYCRMPLHSDGSRQYGIQLVGGSGAGKTAYLAAVWHEYLARLKDHPEITATPVPQRAFDELENQFQTGVIPATSVFNAAMYSVVHTTERGIPVQMTLYDIAGEAFDDARVQGQQQQLGYCEGFILLLDPTATPETASDAAANFIRMTEAITGKGTTKTTRIPLAVVITKGDRFKKEIGPARMRATAQSDPALFAAHRDTVCRDFLVSHDFGNAVNLIEAEFSDIAYFAIAAMGHDTDGTPFEPWGVLEPLDWLMGKENCPLRGIMIKKE